MTTQVPALMPPDATPRPDTHRSPVDRPPVVLDPAALRVIGSHTLIAEKIVPYAVSMGAMRVASATRTPAALARQLTLDTMLDVQVTWASPDEIAAALTAALEPAQAAATLDAQMRAWQEALGLNPASEGPLNRPDAIEQARRQQLQACSLATGRPVINLATWKHNPALAPLIPAELARAQMAVPVLVMDGVLLVAMAAGTQQAALGGWHEVVRRVTADTGLGVQVALAEATGVQKLLDQLYLVRGGARLGPRAPLQEEGGQGLIGAARRAMQATGVSSDADTLGARRGAALNLRELRPDAPEARLIPRQLAERFVCVALDQERGVLRVAAAADATAALAPLLAEVTGRPVRVVTAAQDEIVAALRRVYPSGSGERTRETRLPRLGEYLVHGGQVTGPQLQHALSEHARSLEFLGRVLVRQGALTEDQLLEALALRQDLPAVFLADVLPESAAVQRIPEELARAERMLALRAQDGVLHTAMTDPMNSTGIAAVEQLTGLKVRPLLAAEDDLLSALARLYRTGGRKMASEVERLLDWLAGREQLTRAEMVQVHARYGAGVPIDEALITAGGLPAERVADLLAEATALPRRDLWPHDQLAPVIDALGNAATQHTYVDPIDPVATRRLTLQQAERLAALPVAVEEGRLIVALADPLDHAVQAELRSAIVGRYELVVATREAIRAGIRRTLGRRQVGDFLLAAGTISREELDRALLLATESNVRVGKALLTLGYVTQEQLSLYLAEQFDIPFFDLTAAAVEDAAARMIPEEMARRGGVLPLAVDETHALVAVVDPTDTQILDDIRDLLGRAITPVLATERQMDAALQNIYRAEYVERASMELLARSPEDSAAKTWTRAQLLWIAGICLTFLVGIAVRPVPTLIVVMGLCTLFYFSLSAYKLFLIYRSLSGTLEEVVSDAELAALDDRDLPVYTVLVPVYKEPEVLPILMDALGKMDYPRTKLEVLLLLEEDDKETQEVLAATRLPEGFRALVVPFMRPKTKPKACNYGLLHAEGEFLVIYDAEDVPEPDQLKKAVVVFRRWDQHLACIQSKLNYFNRDQNLLTRWFTVEYSMWFDLLLPGLDNTGAPIPLGGTSNHFRVEALRELGGWDPFNTTEDADLGLRIFKRGYRTVVMNSTTYEEANSNLYNWIRQRSRWVKGYMQTYLVHMRHPIRLYRELGLHAFFSFQMIVGGTCFALMANPVFWLITTLWFLVKWGIIQEIFPGPIFYLGAIGLYIGNFAFVYINVSGALRREYYHLVKYALLTPFYWGLMSVSAWLAFRELIFKPHYWQKTQHGLFTGKARVPVTRKPNP